MSCPICHDKVSNQVGTKNNLTLATCPSCDCLYVFPLPESEQLQQMYDDYLPTDKYLKKLKKKILTSRYKLFRLKKHQNNVENNFLDVGCNIGATVRAAQKSGYKAMGIDLDSSSINKARKLFDLCEFQACSTFELIKTKRQFDFIYCSEVIEHVPDVHSFTQSLFDLMQPGALLYLTTPDSGHPKVPKNILDWKEVKPPEHLVFFNKDNMRLLLEEHHLEIIKFFWNHRANLRVLCRKKLT